jgi:multisubunit Na+/H+ antiporter MnhB subunit
MLLGFIILMRAMVSIDLAAFNEGRGIFGLAIVVIMIITIFIFGQEAVRELPRLGRPLLAEIPGTVSQHYLQQGLKETGRGNTVMAIILDYRIYDTLGLAAVCFAAILGALAILRKKK